MYTIQVHKRFNQMFSLFYLLGLWSRGEEDTVRERRLKLFYSFYFLLFPVSLIIGGFSSASKDEAIFLVESAIMTSVLYLKLCFIIWKKKEFVELMHRIGVYSLKDREEFTLVNEKTKRFVKFVTILISFFYCNTAGIVLVVPFLGSEKKLFFTIGFPLDYENNDVGYWIAFSFILTQMVVYAISFLFSVLMWCLMLNCAIRYEVLGYQIKNMGAVDETADEQKISELEKQHLFLGNLISAIESHKDINELTTQLDLFLSKLFLAQIATSRLCICGSIYCLIYNDSENFIEYLIQLSYLIYNVFDIFMVMYFGNEIKLSSDRLSYCLFESDWVEQPQSTKKSIIIFGEFLRKPHELVILTLYPLTLETFTRILNSAYNMFNILKNLK